MRGLQITKKEVDYHRLQTYELMRVHGIPCTIHPISGDLGAENDSYDIYGDVREESTKSRDTEIQTWMTFTEYPTIRTLRSLGWYVEDGESLSVASIPVHYFERKELPSVYQPSIDDLVELVANPEDPNPSVRKFLLRDFKGNGFPHTIYYTCKLVPMRESE